MTEQTKTRPSKGNRWTKCTASPEAEAAYPDTFSEAAAEGTSCHELARYCLENDTDPAKFLGKADKTGFVFGADHIRIVDDYITNIVDYSDDVGAKRIIEKKVYIDKRFTAGLDVSGTPDVIIIIPSARKLVVIDLKCGRIPVPAHDNAQLHIYALGAIRGHEDDIDEIEFVIFQPRVPGIAAEVELITIRDLFKWRDKVLTRACEDIASGNTSFYASAKTCAFCRAQPGCAAYSQFVFSKIGRLSTPVDKMPDEQLVQIFRHKAEISTILESVQSRLMRKLEDGNRVEGVKLVHKRQNRQWESEGAVKERFGVGCVNRDVMSPAQLEKALHLKPRDIIGLLKDQDPAFTVALEESKTPGVESAVPDSFDDFD